MNFMDRWRHWRAYRNMRDPSTQRQATLVIDAKNPKCPVIIEMNERASALLGLSGYQQAIPFNSLPILRKRKMQKENDPERLVDEFELAKLDEAFTDGGDVEIHLTFSVQRMPLAVDDETCEDIIYVDTMLYVRPVSHKIFLINIFDLRGKNQRFDTKLGVVHTYAAGEEMLIQLIKSGERFGVIYLDVDDFKAFNDRYTHAGGDKVLRVVARILDEHCVPRGALPFRYGGDEFCVILPEQPEQDLTDSLTALARQISEGITHAELTLIVDPRFDPDNSTNLSRISIANRSKGGKGNSNTWLETVHPKVSIGCVLFSGRDSSLSVETVFRLASSKMGQEKGMRKNQLNRIKSTTLKLFGGENSGETAASAEATTGNADWKAQQSWPYR
jgi:GGDEF domain-containing protein